MGTNTQTLVKKDSLRGRIASLMLILMLQVFFGQNVILGQTNVSVCQNGVVRLANYLVDPVYMGAGNNAPPGHLQKGYWSNIPMGLTVSDRNNPNAIISVPDNAVAGDTYTLTWFHAIDQTYDITIEVTNNVSPEYNLLNNNTPKTTDNVLFCKTPAKYEFEVVPDPVNPGALITSVDYIIYHPDGSTYEANGAPNPINFNLNPSIGYQDLDIFYALVSNGTCLDITTNTIQLAEISNVVVQIQGGKSACDPTIFDGNHILEVLPYDPIHFDYQWMLNGSPIAGATTSTYTLTDPAPGFASGVGAYTVVVTDVTYPAAGSCNPVETDPVVISNIALPAISIDDNPIGSGLFEICQGTLSETLTTSLVGGALPANIDYDWYQNGMPVTGNTGTYPLFNDPNDPILYNAFGNYYVVLKDADNVECKSISAPVTVQTIRLDDVTLIKANNAQPFCISGTPLVNVTVTGGSAPYELTFNDGTNIITRTLNSNGGAVSLPVITNTTTFEITNVIETSTGCSWSGSKTVTYSVYTSPSVQTVTGVDACVPTSSVSLTLSTPENGITYQLMRDNNGDGIYDASIGAAITYNTGDPTPIIWSGYTTVGTYRVFASTVTCADVPMDGEYTATAEPVDHALQASGSAPRCTDIANPISFSTNGSENGVAYTLYRDSGSGAVAVETLNGDAVNSDVTFTSQSTAGLYWVTATKAGLCPVDMPNAIEIYPAPDVTGITLASTSNCDNTATTVSISNSETGVIYTLYYDDGSGRVATAYVVNGLTGFSRTLVNNQVLAAGVYTVSAVRGSCMEWLAGSITINSQPLDKSFVTNSYVCGTGNVIINPGESGVSYTLYKNSVADPTYATAIGNGVNPVSFNGLVPGVYTVFASKAGCTRFLTDVLTVETVPAVQTVTPARIAYCADESGVQINLGDTESGVQYLLIDNVSGDTLAITGDGNPRTFLNVTEGNYRVEALSNNYSCAVLLSNNITITENALPTPDIVNLPGDFCEDQPSVTLEGNPRNAGGVWSGAGLGTFLIDNGDGTASFDPGAVSTPGATYNISYTYTDGNGCSNIITEGATVHANAIDGTTLLIVKESDGSTPDTDYCADSPNVLLKAVYQGVDIASNDAVFGGPGVTDHGDGTATFSPTTAGLGTHNITLNYLDPNTNCFGTTSFTVNVGTPLGLVNPIDPAYCSSDNTAIRLQGNVNGLVPVPDNTWFDICNSTGTPIAGYEGLPNNTYDFIPATFFAANGAGDYQIKYNYNSGSCINTLVTGFSLYESVDPAFIIDANSGQTNFCYETGAVSIEGVEVLPTGATAWFTGNGVSGVNFFTNDPNVVYAPASNPVTYTINNNGCITSSSRNITVTKVNVSIVDLLSDYCTNQATQIIAADELDITKVKATFTAEKNGNPSLFLTQVPGTNTATIDPSVGEGNYEVTMTYEQLGDGCIGIVKQNVTVHLAQPVTYQSGFVDGEKVCRSSGLIDLTGEIPDIDLDGNPDGVGNFIEITGVSNTGNDSNGNAIIADDGKAVLDPSAMLPGTYTIRYEYLSDPGSCFTWYEKEIVIVDSPSDIYNITVNDVVGGDASYCIDDAPKGVKIGLDGANTGISYELLLNGNPIAGGPVTYTALSSNAFNFTDDGTPTGTDLLFSEIGIYTVKAYVGDCSSIMKGSVTVEQYELVLQTTNITHVLCKGDNSGSVTLSASGGSGNYEYRNESAATPVWTATSTFNNLLAGTYEFSVRDLAPSACEKLMALSVIVDEPANDLVVNEDAAKRVNVGCIPCVVAGTCEGSATIVVTGGAPFSGADLTTYPTGYSINWPDGQDGLTATGLAAGTYGVTVEDANGCVETINITIENNDPLTIAEYDVAANHVNNECFNGADGEFMVKATGGSGEYMFSLDGVNYVNSNQADLTQHLFTGLTAGNYTLYVQDKKYTRCTFTNATPVTITQPAAPLSLTEVANVQVSCYGGADGSFTVEAAGGNGTYQFSLVNPAIDNTQWQGPTTVPNVFVVSGLAAGNHSVWVRDAKPEAQGCMQATIVVTVSEAVELSFNSPVVTPVSCNSGNDGQVVLSGAGGSGNYVYSIDHGTNWQVSNTFTGLSAGVTYEFSIAEAAAPNTCNQIDILSVILTEPNDFTTTEVVADHKNVNCFGGSDGSFTVTTSGGEGLIEYRLHDGTNYITAWNTNPVFTGLSEGTYEVSVRDRGTAAPLYCEKDRILAVAITQPAAGLLINSESVTPAGCHGSPTGSIAITVINGTPPYNYQWKNSDTNTLVSLANGGESNNPVNLVAGNYEVTITDDNGCILTNTYTVTDNSAIALSLDAYSDVTCYGAADGTITVSASGGSGAYQYSIDGGTTWVGAPSVSYTFTGLGAGLHVVQVEDVNVPGCNAINTVQQNIIQPSQLTMSAAINHVTCNGLSNGSITITASGRSAVTDYEYYCDEIGNWQTLPTFTGLMAGDYHFKVRDRLLPTCESVLSGPFTVTQPVDFTTTVSITPVSCNGDADGQLVFTTLPATGVYTYSVDGGTTWQTSPVSGLSAGVYPIQVQNINTGCIKSIPDAVITEPLDAISIDNIQITDIDCNGSSNGSIEVTVSGGTAPYTYQWRNMSTGIDVLPVNQGDQAKAINLPAGDYRVTITDNKNCSLVSPVYTINQPNELTTTYTVSHISVVGLTDGKIVVTNPPTGGTSPYTITWTDGAGAYNGLWTRDNLAAGSYTFTITDNQGCTFTRTVNVLLTQALDFTAVPNKINCYGDQDGIITVTISGGKADYTISWSGTLYDGSTVSDNAASTSPNYEIKSLYAGDYTVTVADASGASFIQTNIKVEQPAELLINNLVLDDISCNGANDGRVQVQLSGHLAADMDNYSMSWVGPGGYAVAGLAKDVSDQSGLTLAGDYTVTVNYNSTCAVSQTYPVKEPTAINVTYSETHISASGANDGRVVVDTPTGGVSPYTITWADGVAFDGMWNRTGLAPGDYHFTVRDNSGCTVTHTATILGINALDYTYTVTPINCYGDKKGIISLVIKGGVAPFDLHWDALLYDGSTPSDDQTGVTTNYHITDLYAGTYQVRITDAAGANISYSVVVGQPAELIINNLIRDDISCAGAADGHIQVELTGHTAADMDGYTLTWTGPGGFSASGTRVDANPITDQDNLVLPGTYTVTANYNNTCYESRSYIIDEPSQVVVNHTVKQISVAGGSDGQVVVTNPPTGGVGPYTISWSDGAAYDNIWTRDNLPAGTYEYTVRDNINCDVTNTIVIDDADALNYFLTGSAISCYGGSTGMISVVITGGEAPYDIEWNGTQYDGTVVSDSDTGVPDNYEIKNLFAGNYTIRITDNSGAVLDKPVTVGQADQLMITPVLKDISCYGSADGSINLLVEHNGADVSAYPIYWTGPGGFSVNGTVGANSVQNSLSLEGQYNVTINYNGACTVTESFMVNEPDEVVISMVNSKDVSCNGGSDGSLTVKALGGLGFTYKWYKWSTALGAYDVMTETGTFISNQEAGLYKVEATLASTGCVAELEHVINEPKEIVLSVTPVNIVTCNGDASGKLEIEITGGTQPYRYNYGTGDILLPVGTSAAEVSGLSAGYYNVVVTDIKGCVTAVNNTLINKPAALDINVIKENISCSDEVAGWPDGELQVEIFGGVVKANNHNYLVTLEAANGSDIVRMITNPNGVTHTETFNNLPPDSYSLKVYDQNSVDVNYCIQTYDFVLKPITISGNANNATCEGVADGSITGIKLEGVSTNYTFNWSSSDGGVGLDNTTLNQDGLSVGTYILTITDTGRGGCDVKKEFVITYDAVIIIEGATFDVECFGDASGAITLDVKGVGANPVYYWTGPGITAANENDKDLIGLVAGDYTVLVSDGSSGVTCAATQTFTVKQPVEALNFNVKYEITSCDPYERTIVLFNLVGGTGEYNPVAGDFVYNVSGPGTVVKDPADYLRFKVTKGGTYIVKVTDKNDCETSHTIMIPEEIAVKPLITHVKCSGGQTGAISVNLTGGSGSFGYSWTKTDDAAFTSTTPNISNLLAGEYVLKVTDLIENGAGTNCSRTYTFEVKEPLPIIISDDDKGHVTCNGDADGYINLDIQGGVAPYIYGWSPVSGGIVQGLKNQSGLAGGTYSVVVLDDNGCTAQKDITILEDAPLDGSIVITDTQCDGTNGALTLTSTGGSGSYFYNWSSVDCDPAKIVTNQKDQSGLTGGTYNVIITDADPAKSGCQTSVLATLTKAIEIINVDTMHVSCSGNNDGSISFDVIGGDGNYTYTWSTIDGNASLLTAGARNQSGLSPGTYTVTVNDGRISGGTDCAITKDFKIKASTGLTVDVAITDINCHGDLAGELSAVVTGGSGDYSYDWNNGTYTTSSITNVPAGIYILTVVDNNLGCSFAGSYTIKQPVREIRIDAVNIADVLCYGGLTGEIEIQVSGGTAPYKFLWTGPGNPSGSHPQNLAAGTYSVTIQDAKGCTLSSGDIEIEQPASHVTLSNPQITDVSVAGGNNGQVQVDVTGGVAPYEFAWYDATDVQVSTTNPATGLSSGTYRVVVTDNNGCSYSYTGIKVVEPGEALGFEKTVHHVSPCNGDANGELHINRVYGGHPIAGSDYRIQVTGPGVAQDVNATSLDLINLVAGTYRVIITDDASISVQEDITITENPVLSITSLVSTQVNCYGSSTGVIEGSVSGGQVNAAGNYLVELTSDKGYFKAQDVAQSPGAFVFNNLPEGNYTITVFDYAGNFDTQSPTRGNCEAIDHQVITQPEADVVLSSADGSTEICKGEDFKLVLTTSNWDFSSNGSLNVTLYDGTNYWTETITKTPFLVIVSPSMSRTYRITKVADPADSNCLKGTGSGQVQLAVNPLPTANISGPSQVCEDGTVQLSISLSGVAPWTVTWIDENNGTSGTETVNTSPWIISDVPVADARYRVLSVADANSCSNGGDGVVEVTVNPKPTVTLAGSTDICKGGFATLDINFGNTAYPYTISYETNGNPNTMVVSPSSGSIYNWVVSPGETTTYNITGVTDFNGCSMDMVSTISAVVTVKNLPGTINIINSTDDTDGVCQSEIGVTYTIDAVTDAEGGYIWTAPANSTIVSGNGTTSVDLNFDSNFTGGYLKVYATNACGNGAVTERWIPAKLLPEAVGAITASSTEFCQGTTDITFSVDPVANATAYKWELPPGFIISGATDAASITVDLDPMLDVITADIRVTPTNACGDAPNTASITVDVYPLPTAEAGINEDICGDTYTLNAVNPATINVNWSGRWEVISGHAVITNPNAYTTTVTNISRGDVVFRWTVTNNSTGGLNNCAVYDTVIIRNNTLSVSATADMNNVCNGTVNLSGTKINTDNTVGRWEAVYPTGSLASFAPGNEPNTVVTNMEPGLNRFRWTLRQNGCESFAEIEVLNNEPSDAVILNGSYKAICADTITLKAITPVEGIGRWTLISGSGVISSPAAATTFINGLDFGDNVFRYTIEENGCGKYAEITVRNNKLEVDAGADQTVCNGTRVLDATVPPTGVIGRWIIAEGAGSFDDGFSPIATVTGLAHGTNRLIWELNQNGCISTDDITIENSESTQAVVGSNQVICAYETQLTGNAASVGVGFWSIVSGSGTFEDPADPTTRVINLGEGDNVFRWTIINNGCSSTADITVTNLHVEVYAGKDSIVCGRVTRLNADSPALGTGEWGILPGVGGATLSDLYDPNTQAGGLLNGPNGFIWKVTYKGCESRDTIIISNNTPYPVSAGTDQIIAGGATALNATPVVAGEGTWTLVAGGATITDDTNPFSSVSGLRRGDNVFRWTVTNLGCTEYDEVTITNGATIAADAGLDQEVCDNFALLQANDPDVGIGEWSVVSGAGQFDQINNQKTKVNNLGPGINVFRWTIYYTNSKSTDEVVVTNNQVTKANAGPDREICDEDYQLEAIIPAIGDPTWTLISGSGTFDDPTDPNSFIHGLSQGENVLKYEITQSNCISLDTVIIDNKLPTIADAGADTLIVCVDSVELYPNNPTFGTGEWKVKEGAAVISGNWAKELAPGRNVLSWVITSGRCESFDDIVIINNQPSKAFAGADRPVCVDSVILSANHPLYGTGTWELITGSGDINDITNNRTLVTGLSTGKNRFRWTIDNNGCISSDDVEIANNYIQSIAGLEDQVICADTTLLEANNPYPGEGTWGVVGGSGSAYFDEPHNPYSKVRNLDQGDNILTWTISYGQCNSVSQIVITNNNPTTADAGPNQPLCDNHTVLAANAPAIGKGEWSIRNGSGAFSALDDPSATITNLAFGDNLFRWKISHKGCESHDDVQISFNRIDAKVGPDQPVCSDGTTLEANNANPGIGTWSIVGGSSQAVFEDQHNPNTVVSNLAKGPNHLKWTILYKGCETSEEVIITNNSPSTAYAGNSQPICDDEVKLNATAVAIGTGNWEVLTGSGTIADVNDPKTGVTGLSKGDNVFRWTVKNEDCILTDEVLIINNEPSEPYAGKDEDNLCTSRYTLKASTPEYGSGLWTILSGGGNFDDPTSPSATISNLTPGTNVLKWTLTKGQCTLSDEIIIENNTPSIANAGPDVQDCKDWSQLDANIPQYGTGSWSVVSGDGDFDSDVEPKTTIRNLGFGENILMWTVQNGACFSTDQVTVFNKVPDQSAAGDDRSTCDDYIVLNANNPKDGTGTWSVISGTGVFDDPHQFNTIVRDMGYGNNVYKWTIGYGECTTEDEVMITSNKAAPYAGEDDVVYESLYEMQAANPGTLTGTWTIVAGGGTFDDPNFFNTTVRDLPEGKSTYRWTILTDGCSAYDDVTIEYKSVPESGFTSSIDAGCYPLTVKFTNYSIGGTTFHWDFGDGQVTDVRNPSHTFHNPGVYTVVLTAPGPDGQDAVSSQFITVHDHPIANFSAGPEIVWLPDDPVKCNDLSLDAVKWFWDFGDGQTSEEQNPTHYYEQEGIYSVTLNVQNTFGCDNTYVANNIIEAKLSGFVVFPDSFAPRPDGSNAGGIGEREDTIFKPKYRDVDYYHIQIFNRWGQLIFESKEIEEGWDGMYKGKLAPQAVYVYKASGKYVNGVEFNKTGTVLLVR